MSKNLKIILLIGWTIITLFYILSRFYQLKLNKSTSMPQKLWLVKVGDKDLKKGDYVIVKLHDFRMEDPFDYELVVKEIGGIEGDKIKVNNDNKVPLTYIINNISYPVRNIVSGNKFKPLTLRDMVIPKDYYFLRGQREPTFDSRYKEFGLIKKAQVYGKAYPLF